MQSQVLRYIRFFIFGCWGILLLLMLLYGPWMIQAKQITIPDISITNFMIRDTSSFFPMHQEAAEQLIGEGKAVLSTTEAVPNKLPEYAACRFSSASLPSVYEGSADAFFRVPPRTPSLGHQRNAAPSSRSPVRLVLFLIRLCLPRFGH